jgi:hypothetical protein
VPESQDGATRTSQRLYRVDQAALTICGSVDGVRPTKFDAPAGSDAYLLHFRRVKPKN